MSQKRKTETGGKVEDAYSEFTGRKITFILLTFLSLIVAAAIAANIGAASLGVGEVMSSILEGILPTGSSSGSFASTVVWELRLPRVFMAIAVGSGLAIAGTVMQGILKNPLASPYTLGIASAAGFGAALAIVMGFGILGGSTLPIVVNAFAFALLSMFVVLGLARLKAVSPETLILAGVAMMFLFSAGMSLLQYLGTEEQVTTVVFWLMGDLSKGTWGRAGIVSIAAFGTFPLFLKRAWDLNALAAGDETAKSLGVEVERTRLVSLVLAALITASAVCFVGTIGFIGLVSPHICRMVIGGDHRFLLPASCLAGATLLLAADTAARTVLSPLVLPVGILTSFMGVPLFLYLIMRRGREYW